MCLKSKECSELGADPSQWDHFCPLRMPDRFDNEILKFKEAVDLFVNTKRDKCLSVISTIRDEEMRLWCSQHGQVSGRFRKKKLNLPNPVPLDEALRDKDRSPKKLQDDVFRRDGYHCRYCGSKLIAQEFLNLFIKNLNCDAFSKKPPYKENMHGIVHVAWPVADHVHPWNLGGSTTMDNLVSSCGPCNYGKFNWTLEQMGMEDPFNRPPISDEWDGLSKYIEQLRG